jgi:hypothetical protein
MKAQLLLSHIYQLDPDAPVQIYETETGMYKKILSIKTDNQNDSMSLHVYVTVEDVKTLTIKHFVKALAPMGYSDAHVKIVDEKIKAISKPVKVQIYQEKNILSNKDIQGIYLHTSY